MTHSNTNGAILPGCGLPAWVVVTLDAMLSTGILRSASLTGLDADGLTELAREAVRHSLEDFDAEAVCSRQFASLAIAA